MLEPRPGQAFIDDYIVVLKVCTVYRTVNAARGAGVTLSIQSASTALRQAAVKATRGRTRATPVLDYGGTPCRRRRRQ